MPTVRKKPCSICRHWFRPDPRVGARQQACGKAECQTTRRQRTQAGWRAKNPEYGLGYRLQQRKVQEQAPEALRLPAPLHRLPWDVAKDQFGSQGTDFLGVMGTLLVRAAKDQIRAYLVDWKRVSGPLSPPAVKDQIALEGCGPPY